MVDSSDKLPRVAMFPGAAWRVRSWPIAYYIDLAENLKSTGIAVIGLGAKESDVQGFPGFWWWGLPISKVAAMIRRADLVVANDSGPAHLSGAIGVKTLAICGPTKGRLVFGHDENIFPVTLNSRALECTGCHFSPIFGFRDACRFGGCQALMRLVPDAVIPALRRLLDKPNGHSMGSG
jgi:ADP-heptose:LPS heptosyltransferase